MRAKSTNVLNVICKKFEFCLGKSRVKTVILPRKGR